MYLAADHLIEKPNILNKSINKNKSNLDNKNIFIFGIKKEIKSECLVNPIKSSGYPTLAKRPKYSVLNCDKIKKDFNFNIRSWELGVEHCIRQILN